MLAALWTTASDPFRRFFSLFAFQVYVGMGLLAGVIPGLLFAARGFLPWPVITVERQGLHRAEALASGRWTRLFVAMDVSLTVAAAPCCPRPSCALRRSA